MTKPTRKIPPPGRCLSFEEAAEATFKQFDGALRRLAEIEGQELYTPLTKEQHEALVALARTPSGFKG